MHVKTRANKAVAKVAFGALALNAAFPALAFAAEAEQEGGISAILPDMAEFIPMLVIFILLWIVHSREVRLADVCRHAGEAREHHPRGPEEV